MTEFNQENIKDLQRLAKLKLTDAEEKNILIDIKKIIEYIDLMSSIDTKDVPCCNHVSQLQTKNVFRDDEVKDLLDRDVFLENAPDKISGMIKVPSIIKN